MKRICRKTILFLMFSFVLSCGLHAYAIDVIPMGKTVGVKIYTDGLLVIGSTEIDGENIAKKYDIRVNDRITEINGEKADSSEHFSQIVNESPNGVNLKIVRDNQNLEINAVPKLSNDNIYHLGLWVRDSTAGIGTVTYYDPSTKSFAALGHCIKDVDTGNILSVKSGNILNCNILSINKSVKGSPGEINGAFEGDNIGNVMINSQIGIFGKMICNEFDNAGETLTVAAKDQVHEGEAYILSDAFENDNNKYSIEIKKITNAADKSLVLEITDNRLKELSGGIIQGMSGSPIIQDGLLVGAVTHVFVNHPTKGYGTLAENMIDVQMKAEL